MNRQAAAIAQEFLIFQLIEKIEMNFLRAIDAGAVDPVVLALDLCDPLAVEIVRNFGEGERVRRMLAMQVDPEVSPAVVVGVPRVVACEVADDLIPGLADALASIDPGEGYVVVAVTAGGGRIEVMPPVFA